MGRYEQDALGNNLTWHEPGKNTEGLFANIGCIECEDEEMKNCALCMQEGLDQYNKDNPDDMFEIEGIEFYRASHKEWLNRVHPKNFENVKNLNYWFKQLY